GRKWRHGRAFARVRAAYSNFGRARCAFAVAIAPAVPLLLFVRTAAASLRAGLGREFALSAPLVLAGQVAWALGEADSYARRPTRGPARACRKACLARTRGRQRFRG